MTFSPSHLRIIAWLGPHLRYFSDVVLEHTCGSIEKLILVLEIEQIFVTISNYTK